MLLRNTVRRQGTELLALLGVVGQGRQQQASSQEAPRAAGNGQVTYTVAEAAPQDTVAETALADAAGKTQLEAEGQEQASYAAGGHQ